MISNLGLRAGDAMGTPPLEGTYQTSTLSYLPHA